MEKELKAFIVPTDGVSKIFLRDSKFLICRNFEGVNFGIIERNQILLLYSEGEIKVGETYYNKSLGCVGKRDAGWDNLDWSGNGYLIKVEFSTSRELTPDKLITDSDAESIVKSWREGKMECVVSCEESKQVCQCNNPTSDVKCVYPDCVELTTKEGYGVLNVVGKEDIVGTGVSVETAYNEYYKKKPSNASIDSYWRESPFMDYIRKNFNLVRK